MRFLILIALLACGESSEETEYQKQKPKPKPNPTSPTGQAPVEPGKPSPNPGTEPVESAKDKAFVATQKNCANCHNPGFQSPSLQSQAEIEAQLRRVCARVGNGSMPPGGQISGGDKNAILQGFGC
jgi:mono/diheme cytochrome c family protein